MSKPDPITRTAAFCSETGGLTAYYTCGACDQRRRNRVAEVTREEDEAFAEVARRCGERSRKITHPEWLLTERNMLSIGHANQQHSEDPHLMETFDPNAATAGTAGTSVDATLAQRGKRYGDFTDHAQVAQALQDTIRNHGWHKLNAVQRQALTVIADIIARILSGDPNYHDNWHDIQGYARLAEERLEQNHSVDVQGLA